MPGQKSRGGHGLHGPPQVGKGHLGRLGERMPGDQLATLLVETGWIDGQSTIAPQLKKHGSGKILEFHLAGFQRLFNVVKPVRSRGRLSAEYPASRWKQQLGRCAS